MDRDIRLLGLAALAAAILDATPVAAQAPPSVKIPVAPQSEQLDPRACTEQSDTVGQGGTMQQRSDGKTLSERLARSDGVICPPDHVDPEIKQTTPPAGPMPVIPPPGTPGGDPTLRPK
jgi:hypothetical protein